jgi:hypothetical protein
MITNITGFIFGVLLGEMINLFIYDDYQGIFGWLDYLYFL